MRIKMILPALTVAYAGGWKKLEPFWDLVIHARHISRLRPMLEAVLTGFGRHAAGGGASATGEAVRCTQCSVTRDTQTAPLAPASPAVASSPPAGATL